ncbi:bifunctional lysylphosphatidylglycerol flippase/synthetase MprF [Gordonia sp. DT219]|uniref:bifunctional lysylphosphatidylglycerol flippase/synthetase MprF n=1 Tax=Gordonia sp. DT219 TaxID=3416658 RepID=UPI003CEEE5CB
MSDTVAIDDDITSVPHAPTVTARAIHYARVIAGHAPVSLLLFACLLIIGLATGTLWSATKDKSYFHDVAYGVPAFADGEWWTLGTGMFFGLTPWQLVSILIMVITLLAWAEWRLGSLRLVGVFVAAQFLGHLIAALFAWGLSDQVISGIGWEWPSQLAQVRDVGMTTGIVGAVVAASATVRSPWRLRLRLILASYVALSLLFEGSLSDVAHLVAFAVMLPLGERLFSGTEHGFAPRSRREVRLVGFAGLLVIAAADVLVWFFPGSGPLGPTDSDGSSVWVMWIEVALIALVAAQLRRGKHWAWWATVVIGGLNVVGFVFVVLAVAFTDFQARGAVTLGTSLLWLTEVAVLVSGRFAFRVPFRSGVRGDEADTAEVKRLLHAHGGGTMSWMTTWDGNHYLFGDAAAGGSAVTYQRHAGTLLALADPVCSDDDATRTIKEFVDFAESSGLTPCWFSIGADTAAILRQLSWRTAKIAEDSIVDLPGLAFKGKSWQHVRTALNKAKKSGISHRLVARAEEPFSIKAQVRSISDEWVGDKGLPEMGFTLGGVDEALDPEVRVSLAIDEEGNVHGVLSWLPVYAPGGAVAGWTLDVMRRRPDGFGPVIEFLLGSAILGFQREGAQFVSLSGAPLATADENAETSATDRVLDVMGAAMEPLYGFRSLHAFKKKFSPRYEPVYLAYRDESDLPRIGLAISRAYLPQATPGQLVRLAGLLDRRERA